MAMSGNTPIGGPNFNQGYTRPTGAQGNPVDTGAQFRTDDAVTLGNQGTLPGSANFSAQPSSANAETAALQTPQQTTINNVPTVLTVGGLSETSCGHPDISMNGLGRSYIETMGTRQDLSRENAMVVVAGQKPLEN